MYVCTYVRMYVCMYVWIHGLIQFQKASVSFQYDSNKAWFDVIYQDSEIGIKFIKCSLKTNSPTSRGDKPKSTAKHSRNIKQTAFIGRRGSIEFSRTVCIRTSDTVQSYECSRLRESTRCLATDCTCCGWLLRAVPDTLHGFPEHVHLRVRVHIKSSFAKYRSPGGLHEKKVCCTSWICGASRLMSTYRCRQCLPAGRGDQLCGPVPRLPEGSRGKETSRGIAAVWC